MTYFTFLQLENLWQLAGGPESNAQVAAAISIAESSGNDHAISPSGDYGLWQINASTWFGRTGGCHIGWNNWSEALVNACAAVYISGGHNFAAWCTAWADPARDCGHGFLAYPQDGSPAVNVLKQEGKYTSGHRAPVPQGAAPDTADVSAAWGNIGYLFGADARARYAAVASVRAIARKYWSDLIRRG